MPEVRIDVYADQHGAPQELKRTEDALAGLQQQGGETGGALDGLWQQFAVGNLVSLAVTKGLNLLKTGLADIVNAAIEAETADRSLEAALAIAGYAAEGTADDVKGYAEALALKTKYDDEAIKSAQALIVTMRGTTDGLEEETRGALGLASVFKMDLQSAARAVVQGYEGNYIMLGRMIPQVRLATTEAEKHAAMVKGLADYYKRSEDEVNTFGGALSQLKKEFGEVAEQAGEGITKSNFFKDAIKGLTEAIRALRNEAKEHPSAGLPPELNLVIAEEKRQREDAAALKQMWQDLADGVYYEFDAAGQMIRRSAKITEEFVDAFWQSLFTPASTLMDTSGIPAYVKSVEQAEKDHKEALGKIQREWDALLWSLDSGGDLVEESVDNAFGAITTQEPELEAALKSIVDAAQPVGGAFKFSFGGAVRSFDDLAKVTTKGDIKREIDQITLTLRVMGDSLPDKEVQRLKDRIKELNQEGAKITWADKASKSLEKFATAAQLVIRGLDAIVSQSQTNKEIAIENEYKLRLDAINRNVTDEDARQKAIMALEAEYEIRRSSARAAAAKQAKAIAMMEAIVNTASAIAEALPNIPLAIAVGALGTIQVGVIAAQPIPLAKGGVFRQRTRLMSQSGQEYDVAEVEPEAVASKTLIKQALAEFMGGGMRPAFAGGPSIASGAIQVNIYAQTLDDAAISRARRKIAQGVADELRINTHIRSQFPGGN